MSFERIGCSYAYGAQEPGFASARSSGVGIIAISKVQADRIDLLGLERYIYDIVASNVALCLTYTK